MRQREWAGLMKSLRQLTHGQRQKVLAELAARARPVRQHRRCAPAGRRQGQHLAALSPLLPQDVILGSDGSGTLAAAATALGAAHLLCNLSAGNRVVAGVYHIRWTALA